MDKPHFRGKKREFKPLFLCMFLCGVTHSAFFLLFYTYYTPFPWTFFSHSLCTFYTDSFLLYLISIVNLAFLHSFPFLSIHSFLYSFSFFLFFGLFMYVGSANGVTRGDIYNLLIISWL